MGGIAERPVFDHRHEIARPLRAQARIGESANELVPDGTWPVHLGTALRHPLSQLVTQARVVAPEVPSHRLGVVEQGKLNGRIAVDFGVDRTKPVREPGLLEFVLGLRAGVQNPEQALLSVEHLVGGMPFEHGRGQEQRAEVAVRTLRNPCGHLFGPFRARGQRLTDQVGEAPRVQVILGGTHASGEVRDRRHAPLVEDRLELGWRRIRVLTDAVRRELLLEHRAAVGPSQLYQPRAKLGWYDVVVDGRHNDDELGDPPGDCSREGHQLVQDADQLFAADGRQVQQISVTRRDIA